MLTVNAKYECLLHKLHALAAQGDDGEAEAHRLARKALDLFAEKHADGEMSTAELDSLTVALMAV